VQVYILDATISTLTLNLLSGFGVITLVELDLPILTFRPTNQTQPTFNETAFANATINMFPGNQTSNHALSSYNFMGSGSLAWIGLAVFISLVLAGVNRASPKPWEQEAGNVLSADALCKKKFIRGDKMYRCNNCSRDEECVMCADCFNASAHVDHRYEECIAYTERSSFVATKCTAATTAAETRNVLCVPTASTPLRT
jgi:hypothetical protein